jgi:hypothetical protein
MLLPSFLSASFDRRSKDIRVLPIVVPELEFSDMEREIFLLNLWKWRYGSPRSPLPARADGYDLGGGLDVAV